MKPTVIPSASHTSLRDFFDVVRPYLLGPLASPQEVSWLSQLCQRLPGSDLAGFEHVLSGPSSGVDLCLRLPKTPLAVPQAWLETPVWTRINAINDRLLQGELPGVRVLDLEFDISGPPPAIPMPALFLETELGSETSAQDVPEKVSILMGGSTDTRLSSALAACLSALPQQCRVSHVGAMFSRPSAGIRLLLSDISVSEARDFLARVGWRGNLAAFRDVLHGIDPMADSFMLGITVTQDGVARRVGVEYFLDNDPRRNRRFGALLAHLGRLGHCPAPTAESFVEWQGTCRPEEHVESWPKSLSFTEQLLAGHAHSVLVRFLSHIKLTFEAEGIASVKGYRGFCHYFLETSPNDVSASRLRVKDIARRSAFWFERQKKAEPAPEPLSAERQAIGERHLARWAEVAAGGDAKRFERRLRWTELDPVKAVRLLGEEPSVESEFSWEATLECLLDAMSSPGSTPSTNVRAYTNADEPLPFEHALFGIVDFAVERFDEAIEDHRFVFSPEARADLARALLRRLSVLSERVLEQDFNCVRGVGPSILAELGLVLEEGSCQRYFEYVGGLRLGGWIENFSRFPVLARFVATAIDFWLEASCELVGRLGADREAIALFFGEFEERVERIDLGLSDPHHRGRTVAILHFAGGRSLVYKPKPLGLEVAYADLLTWLSEHGAALPLTAPKTLDLQTHGWVEFIERRPCRDEAGVGRFFERSGMLLCVLYCLGANDCHVENIIADEDRMMLIDVETALNPESPAIAEDSSGYDSVLRVGLLPRWDCRESTQHVVELSGLGFSEGQRNKQRLWRHVNTDDMAAVYELGKPQHYSNLPVLGGTTCRAEPYVKHIQRGFSTMYRFVQEHRVALLETGGPLDAFSGRTGRFLFRGTRIYVEILEQVLSSESLEDGTRASIELGRLDFAYLVAQDKPPAWPLLRDELKSLAQLDVPHFRFDTSGTDLELSDTSLERYFESGAHGRIGRRLQRMSDRDMDIQMRLVGACMSISSEQGHRTGATAPEFAAPSTTPKADLPAQALAVAHELHEQVIEFDDGYRSWLGQIYIRNSEHFHVNLLPANMYDGGSGVALFLAACDRVEPDAGHGQLARQAVARLQKLLSTGHDEGVERLIRRVGVGGALGAGSIAYAFSYLGRSLADPDVLDAAARLAKLVGPAASGADGKFDVMGGLAGLALGLLAVYDATGEASALENATRCGERLVAAQLTRGSWVGGWPDANEGAAQVGLSHGASGIALALSRLFAATQREEFKASAIKGLAFERRAYTSPGQSSPDFQGPRKDGHGGPRMNSWCHGATGVALARLSCWKELQNPDVLEDSVLALGAVQQYGLHELDHLCCGNFGRVEALLLGSEVLRRPELHDLATQWTGQIVQQATASGSYRLRAHLQSGLALQNPALFQGLAGIGYSLLRVANPTEVPCVAVWG